MKIKILMILLLCFGFNPAYSEERREELSALTMCWQWGLNNAFCNSFVSADLEPEGDFGPPQPPTPQECGKIWQRCLDMNVEKTKCDLFKKACNNNWKL